MGFKGRAASEDGVPEARMMADGVVAWADWLEDVEKSAASSTVNPVKGSV